jgi:hypothetical protein
MNIRVRLDGTGAAIHATLANCRRNGVPFIVFRTFGGGDYTITSSKRLVFIWTERHYDNRTDCSFLVRPRDLDMVILNAVTKIEILTPERKARYK